MAPVMRTTKRLRDKNSYVNQDEPEASSPNPIVKNPSKKSNAGDEVQKHYVWRPTYMPKVMKRVLGERSMIK